jgi:hypothetical protein
LSPSGCACSSSSIGSGRMELSRKLGIAAQQAASRGVNGVRRGQAGTTWPENRERKKRTLARHPKSDFWVWGAARVGKR